MTDDILDKALELKRRIKESDEFLSVLELMDPTDQRVTVKVTTPKSSASFPVYRYPSVVIALRAAMKEEWQSLNQKYSKL